ncbi:MAG: glycoside hydrolase family 9 protein [Candidatus Hydrogenedentes bacterium]|nr:glycoside hydrolase family 9 protein [Candidatus Hydrogenedentota bacterium]
MHWRRYIAVVFYISFAASAADNPHLSRVFDSTWTIEPNSAREWSQDVGAIDPSRAYIVECRVTVKRGKPWLKILQLDAQGGGVGELASDAPLRGTANDWFALQFQPDPKAAALRVIGGSDAECSFSSLRVLPYSPRALGNVDFSMALDRKQRIPLWNEETAALLPSNRAGQIVLNTNYGRGQPGCVLAMPQGGWCAVSSINYPVPSWSDRFSADTYAKSDSESLVQVAIVWSDDSAQNIVRVDLGPEQRVTDWTRVSMPAVSPPHTARMVRLALIARENITYFDDADIIVEPPALPSAKLLLNQAGYGDNDPKRAVIATNFLPQADIKKSFAALAADGTVKLEGELRYEGRVLGAGGADWGFYYWSADFSELKQPGAHTLQATFGDVTATSHPFELAASRLFYATAKHCVDFFFVQRCGGDVPGWHKPCHMDDAKLPDGTHKDLTGGWHSAGDYNKLSWEYGDGGVMYALATLIESDPEFCSRFNRDEANYEDAMEEAQWGSAYLSKLQTDAGGFHKDIQQGPDRATWMNWAAPDVHTDNVRGTADDPVVLEGEGNSPLAIGGWAKLGALLDERQTENDYLERAFKSWEYVATKDEGNPLLLISTIDLFVVTKDGHFRDFARKSVETILAKSPAEGMLGGGYAESGDVPAAALAHFVIKMPSDSLKSKIKARLKSHIDAIVAEPNNAFGISQQKFGKEGYFFEPTSALGHNYEFLCRAWSAIKVYTVLKDKRALAYALDQMNFVLGSNPYDLCMMEGIGTVNPPRYHHRYIKIPGRELAKIPGAIPNGFVRDMIGNDRPGFDLSLGGREYPSYRTSEPWLVHNVFYLLAVTALHDAEK